MIDAALGFVVHTGWAVAVALVEGPSQPRVVDRRRLSLVASAEHDARFVYHAAAELDARAAADYVAKARDIARTQGFQELSKLLSELSASGYSVLAAGLPPCVGEAAVSLSEILRSHPHIHTAEGALFCTALTEACLKRGLRVVAVPSKKRLEQAARATGWRTEKVKACVARLGRAVGPPWAADQKEAALAALVASVDPAAQ